MLNSEIKCTLIDGQEIKSRIIPIDIVQFERHFDLSAGALDTKPRIEWVLYLLWTSAKRSHQTTLEFDAFMEQIADIADDEDEAAPLEPTLTST